MQWRRQDFSLEGAVSRRREGGVLGESREEARQKPLGD